MFASTPHLSFWLALALSVGLAFAAGYSLGYGAGRSNRRF